MGQFMSTEGEPPPKPKVVLVPPMFERDIRGRSRMTKSSYDHLFGKRPLKWLLGDYLHDGFTTALYFSPSADPRVSVKAKVSTAHPGVMSLRYQPYGDAEPQVFLDIKANPRSAGDVAVRACAFDVATGLGVFATLPLAKHTSNKLAQVGLRYSSPTFTAGAIMQPRSSHIQEVWAVAKLRGWTLGLQLQPDCSPYELRKRLLGGCRRVSEPAAMGYTLLRSSSSSSGKESRLAAAAEGSAAGVLEGDADKQTLEELAAAAATPLPGSSSSGSSSGGSALEYLRHHASFALAYSPEHDRRASHTSFTAAAEMQQGRQFNISFYQHMVVTRQVYNPIEDDDVVGITNYLGLGLHLAMPLGAEAESKSPALHMGAQWQVNKNVLVKGKLGQDSAAVALAAKSWFHPSLAVAASAEYNFSSRQHKTGLWLQIENFGSLRYERSHEDVLKGPSLTQEHLATHAEIAAAAGSRPLVLRSDKDTEFNAPLPTSSSYL